MFSLIIQRFRIARHYFKKTVCKISQGVKTYFPEKIFNHNSTAILKISHIMVLWPNLSDMVGTTAMLCWNPVFFSHFLTQFVVVIVVMCMCALQAAYVVHIFPPCQFSLQNLSQVSTEVMRSCNELGYLLIVITTCWPDLIMRQPVDLQMCCADGTMVVVLRVVRREP